MVGTGLLWEPLRGSTGAWVRRCVASPRSRGWVPPVGGRVWSVTGVLLFPRLSCRVPVERGLGQGTATAPNGRVAPLTGTVLALVLHQVTGGYSHSFPVAGVVVA